MKKHPKLIQADSRGQIVIPKEVRTELGMDESSGFYVYVMKEGIFLKHVKQKDLKEDEDLKELKNKSNKIGISKQSVKKLIKNYEPEDNKGLKEI